jgi:transglutaminase-like putative cysteine protease
MLAKTPNKKIIYDRETYQITRFAFFWLLIALVSVILPHVSRMPVWLTGICAMCMLGRFLIFQGRISYPSNKLKFAIVALMAVLLLAQYGRDIFSTDATVAILLVGITLKLLEMQHKRDVLLVLYLGYFTIVAEFIYTQSIPIAFYMSLSVVLISSALMALHQNPKHQSPLRTLKLTAVILAQSVPLMLVFFILFPRISPLWSVPLQTNTSTTGLSDSMSPGDISKLTRSAEVAFRVKFNGAPPTYSELYWRALTLDEFDGREWRHGFVEEAQFLSLNASEQRDWFRNIEYLGEPVTYNIIMEPTNQNWIFTLRMPRIFDDRMLMSRDYQLGSRRRINQRFSYEATSYLENRADVETEGRQQRRSRILPAEGNPQAHKFALDLRAQMPSDTDYINAVLEHFREEEFFYTLSPATLGDNSIDDFLFNTREGFCEHYASSFTFLMRAVNIPARVVTGYQGGEFNPFDETLTVRQFDAHAWAEVWLPAQGWVRVDPTAAVAPERISQGSEFTLQEESSFMDDEVFSLLRFRDSLLFNNLRFRIEMIDYAWNRFVLNYDQDTQFSLLTSLLGTITKIKVLLSFMVFMTLFIIFIVISVFRKSSTTLRKPALQHYLRFCSYLGKLGFARNSGETPWHYQERVSLSNPQLASEMQGITQTFVELAFTSESVDPEKIKRLIMLIRKFRMMN